MAYRPRPFTTTSSAQRAVNWDPARTNLVITNISGETCYMGADITVATSGNDRGAPIFNNGGFSASFGEGLDPRVERWLIGTAGGIVIIFEEFAPDPYLISQNALTRALLDLVDELRGRGKILVSQTRP